MGTAYGEGHQSGLARERAGRSHVVIGTYNGEGVLDSEPGGADGEIGKPLALLMRARSGPCGCEQIPWVLASNPGRFPGLELLGFPPAKHETAQSSVNL